MLSTEGIVQLCKAMEDARELNMTNQIVFKDTAGVKRSVLVVVLPAVPEIDAIQQVVAPAKAKSKKKKKK